ncbi:hypothetical protein A9R01_16010 ['Osedax' symbiont bacterium Rs2_46_30_T18]|nr:hypothetical protein A9R01_16010 ['Osedax' symbiont bacterium Rs2_46_30_T18]
MLAKLMQSHRENLAMKPATLQAPKLTGKHQVSASVIINASQRQVWELLEDFYDVYTWVPTVKKSHSLNDKELGIGAGRFCELDGFGSIEEYITAWYPGVGFVYRITPLGPLDKSHSSWWLTQMPDGRTELAVALSYNIRFGLFGKVMHKLVMRKKLEESLPGTLLAVKHKVESNAVMTSSAA